MPGMALLSAAQVPSSFISPWGQGVQEAAHGRAEAHAGDVHVHALAVPFGDFMEGLGGFSPGGGILVVHSVSSQGEWGRRNKKSSAAGSSPATLARRLAPLYPRGVGEST